VPLDGVWLAPGGFPQQEELGGERGTWNELLGGLDRLRQERCEIALGSGSWNFKEHEVETESGFRAAITKR